ncbi:hypothetical protein WG66_013455, partial [Moniliophthora roreri]
LGKTASPRSVEADVLLVFDFDLRLERYQRPRAFSRPFPTRLTFCPHVQKACLCRCSSGFTRPSKHGPIVTQFWHPVPVTSNVDVGRAENDAGDT